jgi:hypothetical protein
MVLNGGRRLLIALAVVACGLAWWNLATANDAVGGDVTTGAVRGTATWQASVARQDAIDAQLNTHHGLKVSPRVLLHEEDLAAALEPANPRHVLMERTAFYCNSHPFRNLTASPLDPTPAELVVPQYADRELVLVQVHTYIRHGDRANLAGGVRGLGCGAWGVGVCVDLDWTVTRTFRSTHTPARAWWARPILTPIIPCCVA